MCINSYNICERVDKNIWKKINSRIIKTIIIIL